MAIFVGEIQYLSQKEVGALITAMHKVQQRQLPLVLLGAGLPILPGLAAESRSYAERLFSFPEIGALSEQDTATRSSPSSRAWTRISFASVSTARRRAKSGTVDSTDGTMVFASFSFDVRPKRRMVVPQGGDERLVLVLVERLQRLHLGSPAQFIRAPRQPLMFVADSFLRIHIQRGGTAHLRARSCFFETGMSIGVGPGGQ